VKSKFYLRTEDNLKLLNDEQLIKEIKNENNDKALDFLMGKYKPFVFARAKSYYMVGGEKQDIIQEGLIGLFKAIKNFDSTKENSFKNFADLCIRRQIVSAIKTSTRQKHTPLNNCISLNSTLDDDENDKTLEDILGSEVMPDPSDTIVNKETFLHIKSKITSVLSSFEQEVLDYHLCGYTYTQIASSMKVEPKSVDNAVQRIKKKMEKTIYDDSELN